MVAVLGDDQLVDSAAAAAPLGVLSLCSSGGALGKKRVQYERRVGQCARVRLSGAVWLARGSVCTCSSSYRCSAYLRRNAVEQRIGQQRAQRLEQAALATLSGGGSGERERREREREREAAKV